MSALEPPVPANQAHSLDAEIPHIDRPSSRTSTRTLSSKTWQRWRRVVGLLLLAITVFLWTMSNFLASSIFADDSYSKPYFVTYVNTSFFIVPLIPILGRKAYRHPGALRQWRDEWRERMKGVYVAVKGEDGSPRSERRRQSLSASEELLLGDPMDGAEEQDIKNASSLTSTSASTDKLSLQETAKLSLEFCMLWFLANYFVAACLEYTTVASSTILTSTSSVFTLIFGAMFKVEHFTLRKLIAVIASLAGIVLISSMDLSGSSSDDEHRGDFPEKSLKEIAIGDALAFLSAVMYGLYAVFMKKRIGDESRVDMPVFFGLVGLINVLLLWPGFLILHFTDIERFEMPPSAWVTAIILSNSLASLVSDLAWAYAVLLTSPIVVTVGLSMTIPLSLIGQIVLNNQTVSPMYWVGALIVVASFVFVNHEEKVDEVANVTSGSQHDQEALLGGDGERQEGRAGVSAG